MDQDPQVPQNFAQEPATTPAETPAPEAGTMVPGAGEEAGAMEGAAPSLPVPEEILNIPRPEKTVVQDLGEGHDPRYIVRNPPMPGKTRNGRHYLRNGQIVGAIVDGVYQPRERIRRTGKHTLVYGPMAFALSVGRDMTEDLEACFGQDADTLAALVLMRALNPASDLCRLAGLWDNSWGKLALPDVDLQPAGIGQLLVRVGQDKEAQETFARLRQSRLSVDEALFETTFGRGLPLARDLATLGGGSCFAGDLEEKLVAKWTLSSSQKEPVSFQILSGNEDVPLPSFVSPSLSESLGLEAPVRLDLRALSPEETRRHPALDLARSEPDGDFVDLFGAPLFYRVQQKADGSYLHAYVPAQGENAGCLAAPLILELGTSMDPALAHGLYVQKSLLAMALQGCRSADNLLEEANLAVREAAAAAAPENAAEDPAAAPVPAPVEAPTLDKAAFARGLYFVDCLSAMVNLRMINKCVEIGLLARYTFGEVLEILNCTRRMRETDAAQLPGERDGLWLNLEGADMVVVAELGLCTPAARRRRRRSGPGRVKSEFVGPKRPRGRRKKAESEPDDDQTPRRRRRRKNFVGPVLPPNIRRKLERQRAMENFVGPIRPKGRRRRRTTTDTPRPTRADFVGPRRPRGRPKGWRKPVPAEAVPDTLQQPVEQAMVQPVAQPQPVAEPAMIPQSQQVPQPVQPLGAQDKT